MSSKNHGLITDVTFRLRLVGEFLKCMVLHRRGREPVPEPAGLIHCWTCGRTWQV